MIVATVFVAISTRVVEVLTLVVTTRVRWWTAMVRHIAHVVLRVMLVARVVIATVLAASL